VTTSRQAAWVRAGLVLVAVVVLDQVTKALVRGNLQLGDEHDVVGSVVKLVRTRNTGVAFGAFSGGGIIVVALVVAALTALVYYFATHADRPLVWLPTGLLLGGALGNIIDRVADGSVTDFIKLPSWPQFNVADIAITVGVFVLLWVVERGGEEGGDGADGRAG